MFLKKPCPSKLVEIDDETLEGVAALVRLCEELARENANLKEQVLLLEKEVKSYDNFGGFSYDKLRELLGSEQTELSPNAGSGKSIPLLTALYVCRKQLALGVTDADHPNIEESLIYHQVASRLLVYGLVTQIDSPRGDPKPKLRLTPMGARFISRLAADIFVGRKVRETSDKAERDDS